ncbi:hypothetical protein NHF49_012030 [Arthrobacter sp. H16F315]|uniref:hypothetical protein n=1 Tax=Arthrobacter sp. H16F315 TaxID=2955314 RepID=UPI0020978A81|nr:hypothetical protein [Arthrobacter sp. H16F315]MDD1477428.1 hypothetical protein [Arthrobacter sp. H16F315]
MPQHVRHHQSGVHAMYPDAAAFGLPAQRLGELADPALARGIGVLQRHRTLVALAVDVNEVAVALGEEHWQRDPGAVERAEDIRAHHPREVVDRGRRRRPKDAGGTCVVYPDVEHPAAEGLLAQGLDVGQFSGVAGTSGRRYPFRAQPLDGGRDVDLRPGRQHHSGAPVPQDPGHGKPQTTCRASHDRHAPAEEILL